MKKILTSSMVLLLVIALGIANAEPTLTEVLNTIYGAGNWTEVGYDQLWNNLDGTAKAQAKYAGLDQFFGYLAGTSGGTLQLLFNVTNSGNLGGSPSATFSQAQTGPVFRFADYPDEEYLWSSQVSDNSDNQDHMRTFLITSGSSAGNYAIAWEDLPDGDADWDYQDLVIEISGAKTNSGSGRDFACRHRRRPYRLATETKDAISS